MPKKSKKLRQLAMMSKMPTTLVWRDASEADTLLSIKKMIPKKLIATPPALRKVMGSFKTKAAINIVRIGEMALTMEQSMGVISGMAIRKVICVRKKPNTEAKNIFTKSFRSTFWPGVNKEMSQKSIPAPIERRQKRAIGDMRWLLVRSLQTMMLMPKIE